MKTLDLSTLENIEGGGLFSSFCKGFAAAQVGWGLGVLAGLATPPGWGAGAVILTIDAACLLS